MVYLCSHLYHINYHWKSKPEMELNGVHSCRTENNFFSKNVFNSYLQIVQRGELQEKIDFGTEDCSNEMISKKGPLGRADLWKNLSQ